jgi:putative ABC transport system permease protein
VLALSAAAIGVPLAYLVLHALVVLGPANIPRLTTVGLDARVLTVALVVSTAIGLVFGMLPVAQARRIEVQTALKAEDSRGATRGRDGRVVRSALVVAEVALAVVLVTGAGLLIHSFWNLSRTDPGFDVSGVMKAEFQLPGQRYPTGSAAAPEYVAYNRFTRELLDRVDRVSGVESAALAANHPLDTGFTQSFSVPGREAEAADWPELSLRHITPPYFRTLHVPLVEGRLIDDSDTSSSDYVVLINEAIADRFFPNQDPVGQPLRFWGANHRIVGVVGNERIHGLANAAPITAYAPLSQTRMTTLALLVRTAGDPSALGPSVRGAIREIDPAIAVFGVEPLLQTLSNSLSEPRFMMLLLALFGGLAMVLAAVGVHGVLAYLVTQRTREIGVRVALGATGGQVTRLIVGRGLLLVATGLALGFALALMLSRSLSGLLYGVTPTDAPTLAGVVAVIAAVAAAAIWLPARRATRVDPLEALRQE